MLSKHRPILVIGGPTAAGKSRLAMELAKHIPLEVISADARQVFQHLNIGTAKPTAQEQLEVQHHCIDICHPSQTYNASQYLTDSRKAVTTIPETTLPVVVGGSGLYINAMIDGFSTVETEPNEVVRLALQDQFDRDGLESMFAELRRVDSEAAEKYSDKNPRRVIRALEYFRTTGEKLSATWRLPKNAGPYTPVFIGVRFSSTQVLRNRIDLRCNEMWDGGIVLETQQVLDMGVDRYAQALSTVGYREVIQFLRGEISEVLAIEKMKTATRQYAKRQRTWFYKDERYTWFEGSNPNILNEVLTHLKTYLL